MRIRHHLALRQLSSVRRQLEERASTQELVRFLWAVTKHTHGLRNWKHLTPEEKIARVKTHHTAGLLTPPDVAFYVRFEKPLTGGALALAWRNGATGKMSTRKRLPQHVNLGERRNRRPGFFRFSMNEERRVARWCDSSC
jgi:hypothetical protein